MKHAMMVHQHVKRIFVVGWICFVGLLFCPALTYAASIVSDAPVLIANGQKVEDVIVIGNNADIRGRVSETLLVIDGNVHLASTARAEVVIDIGGTVSQDPGSAANQVFTLSFNSPLRNSLAVGTALIIAIWAVRLALSVAIVLIPVLITLLLTKWIRSPMSYIEQSARYSALTGVIASVAILAIAAIVGITIIGLPIALFILLLYGVLGLLGLSVASVWIGRLAGSGRLDEHPLWMQSGVGAVLIMAFSNIPLIGPLLFFLAWVVGTGALCLQLWNKLKKRNKV